MRIALHSASINIRCSNILLHLKLSCFNVAMMSGFKISSNMLDISSLEALTSQQTNWQSPVLSSSGDVNINVPCTVPDYKLVGCQYVM